MAVKNVKFKNDKDNYYSYFNDKKISDCLDKISQDFSNLKKSLKKKFEIIIINDGSKKIKITNKKLPIKLVNKKKNEGVGK